MEPRSGELPSPPSSGRGRGEGNPDNAAWVDVELPQPAPEVADYVRDVERLLRLNPHLDLQRLSALPGGFALEAVNETNGLAVSRRLTFRAEGPWRYVLGYDGGLKQSTEVEVTPHGRGSRLRIRETYREPTDDAELAEVDRSLTAWGQALRRHFLALARWGRFPPYRWWRERVWLPMRPRERRILSLFVWITALEFAFFLLVLAVYLAEAARA